MADPTIRPPASITPEQGILIIDAMVKDIDGCPDLAKSDFGKDVRRQALNLKGHLREGGFFSAKAEKAINNWNKGVLGWTKKAAREIQ